MKTASLDINIRVLILLNIFLKLVYDFNYLFDHTRFMKMIKVIYYYENPITFVKLFHPSDKPILQLPSGFSLFDQSQDRDIDKNQKLICEQQEV